MRPHLYFASAALLAGPGWARAGGRAGLGQDWRPMGGAAWRLSASWACSWAGLGEELVGGRWAGCLGWAGAGGQRAGLACGLRWRLSASWCALGLAGWFVGWAGQTAGGWPVGRLPAMARHCLWAGSRAGLVLAASGQGCSALVVAGRCELGWASWLVSSAGQFPAPPLRSHPFPGVDWQKQATEECENEGSDVFRNYWIYEVMFRCSVLARSDAVRSKDCFL